MCVFISRGSSHLVGDTLAWASASRKGTRELEATEENAKAKTQLGLAGVLYARIPHGRWGRGLEAPGIIMVNFVAGFSKAVSNSSL